MWHCPDATLDAKIMIMYWFISTILIACAVTLSSLTSYFLCEERKIHWKSWSFLTQSKKEGGIGFRDIRSFNLATLAKQGWRLLQDKNSLLYNCFKAKYFPRCEFLQAKDCQNRSYVWKSLLAAQPVLRRRCYWRVGNDASIHVLKDYWLPNQSTRKILFQPEEDIWEWRVSDLIDWQTH